MFCNCVLAGAFHVFVLMLLTRVDKPYILLGNKELIKVGILLILVKS